MTAVFSTIRSNPYDSAHSCYGAWRENEFVGAVNREQKFSRLAQCAHGRFRQFVAESDFPCVGAKAAINGNCYRYGFYSEMNTADATIGLAHDLWTFAHEQTGFGTNYATFVASFAKPVIENEKIWEEMLWTQLQSLHELDNQHHAWDASVSSDTESADFSFSFAETGFFVVGLHPGSSRLSRQFAFPTLVFNPHAQFERLREENKFERMQQTIRARDLKLQNSLNPNLSNYGDKSEARQYSGRAVEENWRCPFHALTSAAKNSLK